MKESRIVLAQISMKLGCLEENIKRHREIILKEREKKTDLVVFPELSLTGYQLKDLVSEVSLTRNEMLDCWSDLGEGHPIEFAIGFLECSKGYQYYNAMMHILLDSKGNIEMLHCHRKLNLPTYGMFEEERYFAKGNTLMAYDSPLLGRCGMLICEDLWHPANMLLLSLDGPELEGVNTIIVGANSPARGVTEGQNEPENLSAWKMLSRHAAFTSNSLVLVCQRVGVEDGFVYTGGSEIVAPGGIKLASGELFREEMTSCNVNLGSLLKERRTKLPGGARDDYYRLLRELKRLGISYLGGEL